MTRTVTLGGDRALADARPGDDHREPLRSAASGTSRLRVDDDDAGRRRQPVGLVGRGRRPDCTRRVGRGGGIGTIGQGNDYVGIGVTTTVSPPADAWWAPVETISNSEGGFERVYQGSGLLLSWIIDLAPGESASFVVAHAVATTLDRAGPTT